ncbi:MAG: UDP-N-acetylmuramoyl-tripeptide--D-alanyl-D-alanine ligase [Ignavibacteria bacterium]|nr:UDP-N-acetylmuramoyl-tripeptide--D-alanyl-D-alanine ligase [Ignavibacteria bacterium]
MLKNKAAFNGYELEVIFGKTSLLNIQNDFNSIGVSIDSRSIESGNIFVALPGSKIDGHSKVAEAFEQGAAAAVVEKGKFENEIENFENKSFIIVENSQTALGKFGKFHRNRFEMPIIAVAGSNGKTTTKEMIANLLSIKYKVLKTHANFNNQLGVPLMLLQLSEDYYLAVLEMGTNEPGEISILSEMVCPTDGIITNIGKEHLEKLIDLDGVEMEETSLFGYLNKHAGMAFINSDDSRLTRYQMVIDRKFTFGSSEESNLSGKISFDSDLNTIIEIQYGERRLSIHPQTFGYAGGLNALAAAAVGAHFGLSNEEIILGIESFSPDKSQGYGRMLCERVGGIMLINDCYNANPNSMKAALEDLSRLPMPKEYKIAVLGDMFELGEAAPSEHLEILELASGIIGRVFLTGENFKQAFGKAELNNVRFFSGKENLIQELVAGIKGNETVLVKGSRGMKMETVVSDLKSKLIIE